MEARKVAAQFAAYTWFENTQESQPNDEAKARFARENWQQFLPIVHEGLGRLLIKIAAGRSNSTETDISFPAKVGCGWIRSIHSEPASVAQIIGPLQGGATASAVGQVWACCIPTLHGIIPPRKAFSRGGNST